MAVVPSRRQAEVATARAAMAPRAPQPPKIYKSPQHFPSRDRMHFANENALHSNNIAGGPPMAIAAPPPPPRGRARHRQGRTQVRAYHQGVAPPPQPKPRSRSPFGRFISLSPGKRRQSSKQNLTFSHENETFVFEPGSEFEESFYSTDNDGRTQLTRMLGGDKRLSQKVKAHIERKVDEETAARFEKMSLKEKIHAERMEAEAAMAAAAAASRRKKTKKSDSAKRRSSGKKKKSKRGKSRSYSSDEESQASLGELLEQACTGTGRKGKYYDEESTKYSSSDSSSDEGEETEYTMGTMTLIEKAEKLSKMKKKKKKAKSKKKRQSSLPEGCKKVRCPPGRLGISIDTTAHGPAIGYIAPKSPLIGLIEVGDIIVAIDREDVTHLDAEDVMDMLSERKDEYRKLIIQI